MSVVIRFVMMYVSERYTTGNIIKHMSVGIIKTSAFSLFVMINVSEHFRYKRC